MSKKSEVWLEGIELAFALGMLLLGLVVGVLVIAALLTPTPY